ncbi:MAG: M20/M25/M40 family metallo-hydrolase [Abditibacteriota bacterium]|nr:M20/M25/M40 family metallo-hydrolase [Abditibacteriota bacterium]
MINKERLLDDFLSFCLIPSVSGCERRIADAVTEKLEEMGFSVYEDGAGAKINGEAGNIIATLEGSKDIEPVIFSAHMDSVESTEDLKPVIVNGIISSDKSTILAADDKTGIAVSLEGIRSYLESGRPHGDIQCVFTVSEENGLNGSSNLDFSRLLKGFVYVMDSGSPVCSIVLAAPSQKTMTYEIIGKAAHAGMEPEAGINSIACAAAAINGVEWGRIDAETTCNAGVITGGRARNIVPDKCTVQAEARSHNRAKLEALSETITSSFRNACKRFGAELEYSEEDEYRGFSFDIDDPICRLAVKAARKLGVEPETEISGGGFDANKLNAAGIPAVALGTGYENCHTHEEFIREEDLFTSAMHVYCILETLYEESPDQLDATSFGF